MLKACPYCKKVHKLGYICPEKPAQNRSDDRITRFRSSKQWQIKRDEIYHRDLHMCRLCAAGYGDMPVEYNPDVSAHHIEPLAEAWSLRLDDDNIISLCSYHHELADNGKISRVLLKKLAKSPISPSTS